MSIVSENKHMVNYERSMEETSAKSSNINYQKMLKEVK
jgi:hypothetical protein